MTRPMAAPPPDPDAMSFAEKIGTVLVAIELVVLLFMACLFLPAQL